MAITPNDPANFSPTLQGYTGQGAFRFWCQTVLPLVYDDSLSYYELLNKVVNYLNNVISDVSQVETNVGEIVESYNDLEAYVNSNYLQLVETYNQLENYVNDYFENLDVHSEINTKLDEMASSGALSVLIAPIVPQLVADWLAENITPTTPVVDATLSVQGAAADAKKTGEGIGDLKSTLKFTTNVEPIKIQVEDKYLPINNNVIDVNNPADSSTGYGYSIIPCAFGDVFTVSGVSSANVPFAWAFVDSNYSILTKAPSNVTITNEELIAPINSSYLIIHDKKPYRLSYTGKSLNYLSQSLENWIVSDNKRDDWKNPNIKGSFSPGDVIYFMPLSTANVSYIRLYGTENGNQKTNFLPSVTKQANKGYFVTLEDTYDGMKITYKLSSVNSDTYYGIISKVGQNGAINENVAYLLYQTEKTSADVETIDEKLANVQSNMPTFGDLQYFNSENSENLNIINARLSSVDKLIADNNYRAIIFPFDVVANVNYYWATVFSDSVTLAEINLYTFNSVEMGAPAVNKANSYGVANVPYARLASTEIANYLVVVVHITSGTIEDVIDGLVISKQPTKPTEYVPYWMSVNEAIDNAISKKTSPDCVEVGTNSNNYPYTNINTAVSQNPESVIKINYGTYETEVENLSTDKIIIGEDVNLCVLEKHNGSYNNPPIEIAGGIIKNLTVKMINDTEASQYGYCVHSDNSATANNTLIISNCKFENDLYRVIGMGVRGGETVIFENCEFVGHGTNSGQAIYIHNSDGERATVRFRNCYFKAVNACLILQAWSSGCNIDWEFIDCTCYSENYGTGIETIWTDYVAGDAHDTEHLHEFRGRFTLLPTSHGNNINILNYSN